MSRLNVAAPGAGHGAVTWFDPAHLKGSVAVVASVGVEPRWATESLAARPVAAARAGYIASNSPISNAVRLSTSALAAWISPSRRFRSRMGAIAKYWKTIPSASAAR